MTEIRVWAPNLAALELVANGKTVRMQPGDNGWHSAQLEPPELLEYSLQVDGRRLPDPRSGSQPNGVHGASQFVRADEFRWSDGGWTGISLEPARLIYEMHIGTFTRGGTFTSAIERLDHLVDLGVHAVEVMPVAEFSGTRGWGYDGVDLYAPHHSYGGPTSFRQFVDACHAKGIAVVLDVVYNHVGPEGNYLNVFGPYFTHRYETPWGQAINLDGPGSDEVRNFICENSLQWMRDFHVDGFRLDAVHELVDRSAVHILEELTVRIKRFAEELDRRVFLIAESDLNDPRLMHDPGRGGYGLDAQWCDDFHHSLHAVLTGERTGYYEDFGSLSDLAKSLRQGYVFDGRYSLYRGRHHGRPPIGLGGRNFVVYLQNHDQVGNRARGDRSSALMSTARLKIGAALVLTSAFVPMLFQGEEWGASTPFQYFTDHQDPDLARAVSEGRRREFAAFGWNPGDVPDPQSLSTFERSQLDWDELAREPHREILDWHRELVRLRAHPDLADGDLDRVSVEFDEQARWLAMRRGRVTVACNFAPEPRELVAPEQVALLAASSAGISLEPGRLLLPPESVAIYEG